MQRGSISMLNLDVAVDKYLVINQPRRWGPGYHYKADWTNVESKVTDRPLYKLQTEEIKGSMRAFNVEFENESDTEQKFELSETLQSSNRCTVQVQGGVLPGAAPLKLRTPPELGGSGLPPALYLRGADSPAAEEVTWRVSSSLSVAAFSTVSASVSGDEQHLKGSFEQKMQLTGSVVLRYYDAEGVFLLQEPVGVDVLVRDSQASQEGMRLFKGGIEFTLTGACSFYLAVNNKVRVKSKKM